MLENIKVLTRDGYIEKFDPEKIQESLRSDIEFARTIGIKTEIDQKEIRKIVKRVVNKLQKIGPDPGEILSSDTIRGMTVSELINRGEMSLARVVEIIGMRSQDIEGILIGNEDKDNANLQPNPETSHKRIADEISKKYYLMRMPKHLAELHLRGDLHIHDLEYFGTRPFCQDHDLRYFFYYGLMPDGNGNKASVSAPAQNPEVAILHAVKALSAAQTNFAGGQGFYNFLTFIAPYLEGLDYKHIKQLMQMFVYEMTQMMVARGGQVVFSSVQLTPGVPKLWKDKPVVYKGRVWNGEQAPLRTYGEFEREVRMAFEAIMDVMITGDYWGKPFYFPKPEVVISPEFTNEATWDQPGPDGTKSYRELYLMACTLSAKYGTPYYDNMIPAYRKHNENGISCYQCCAYNLTIDPTVDKEFDQKIYFKGGKHFSMGSMQVVTINLPRAAYKVSYRDDPEEKYKVFIEELYRLIDAAVEIFEIKSQWIEKQVANGRLPFITQRPKDPVTGERGTCLTDLSNSVYTIGIIGMNETVEVLTGYSLHEHDCAIKTAERIMYDLKLYILTKYGSKVALARTPAEVVAQRFAVLDLTDSRYTQIARKYIKGDIDEALKKCTSGEKDLPIYYTNGCMVPYYVGDLFTRMAVEHRFFPIVDGGNIFHVFLGENNPYPESIMSLIMKIAKNTNIGYFAITLDMTVCEACGYTESGIWEECSRCGSSDVDIISRITGYMSAVSGWNAAKKQELKDRARIMMQVKG